MRWFDIKINHKKRLIKEYTYDEFGKVYERKENGEHWGKYNKSDIGNTRLFTGREYDKEIGLYYYRARYYSAELGSFISRDPIGVRDNVNLYSYVGNNPVKFVDAMGREKKLFIRNNEGNAWYIDTSDILSWNSGHAMLLYIFGGKEQVISFMPNSFPNWVLWDTQGVFFSSQTEINVALDYVNRNEWATFIDKSYIDTQKVDYWFNNELQNTPTYNTLTNNCSTEVEKALGAWWIDLITPIDSPWHLEFALQQELQKRKLLDLIF